MQIPLSSTQTQISIIEKPTKMNNKLSAPSVLYRISRVHFSFYCVHRTFHEVFLVLKKKKSAVTVQRQSLKCIICLVSAMTIQPGSGRRFAGNSIPSYYYARTIPITNYISCQFNMLKATVCSIICKSCNLT